MNRAMLVSFLFLFPVHQTWTSGGEATDVMLLEGKWKLVKSDSQHPPPNTVIQFQGKKFKIFFDGEEQHSGTVCHDPTKFPKHLDLQVEKSLHATYTDKLLLAIYDVKGNKMTICINDAGNADMANGVRPTQFASNGSTSKVAFFEKIQP